MVIIRFPVCSVAVHGPPKRLRAIEAFTSSPSLGRFASRGAVFFSAHETSCRHGLLFVQSARRWSVRVSGRFAGWVVSLFQCSLWWHILVFGSGSVALNRSSAVVSLFSCFSGGPPPVGKTLVSKSTTPPHTFAWHNVARGAPGVYLVGANPTCSVLAL